MMNPFKFVHFLYCQLCVKLRGTQADHTEDYDIAAATYDEYYSRHLSGSATVLMERLPLAPGMHILDLACGTGFFTQHIARQVGPQGNVIAVDLSQGMLQKNREQAIKNNLHNIQFHHEDGLNTLRRLPDASLDGVVCGWAICYIDQQALRIELERVVRSGGFIGIIENRACTLQAVSTLFTKALLRRPTALTKNISLNLPRHYRSLQRIFCRSLFSSKEAWHGSVTIPCKTGQQVAEYMVHSGAAAGFLNALDPHQRSAVLDDFVQLADQRFANKRPVPVQHDSCSLLAVRK